MPLCGGGRDSRSSPGRITRIYQQDYHGQPVSGGMLMDEYGQPVGSAFVYVKLNQMRFQHRPSGPWYQLVNQTTEEPRLEPHPCTEHGYAQSHHRCPRPQAPLRLPMHAVPGGSAILTSFPGFNTATMEESIRLVVHKCSMDGQGDFSVIRASAVCQWRREVGPLGRLVRT